jgi:DNA-directed RNA polymerase specialized sigma24 family protein
LALELVELEGLSYAEAGARLHVGISNMKMIMFRARRRLRAKIGAALDVRRATLERVAV